MSAVMPAPEDGSNPAIVNTTGGVTTISHCKPKIRTGKQNSGSTSGAAVGGASLRKLPEVKEEGVFVIGQRSECGLGIVFERKTRPALDAIDSISLMWTCL